MTEPEKDFGNLIRVRISNTRNETYDIRKISLVSEDGSALPAFQAGAHVDLVVHLPDRSRALRSYSIASPPSEKPDEYTLAILFEEDGTGGSMFLHEQVRPGYIIEMSAPKNYFKLESGANHSILIAGGIGITPILSMAHELKDDSQSFELHYVSRSPDTMAFKDLLEGTFRDTTQLYFDDGDPSKGIDINKLLETPKQGNHIYVCGPKGMINSVRSIAESVGWEETQVHYEIFTPPEALAGDAPVEVVAAKSEMTIHVSKETTILEALENAGIECDYDCRIGICGTCSVKVLEGDPAHRDNVLLHSEHQEGMMCTCVSRSNSPRLVLDI